MIASALLQLFAAPPAPALLNHGKYDPALVALSILVALFSSWMGLRMAGRGRARVSRALRKLTLLTGSLALGCGVWAMHFIGMLAFDLCTRVDYDPFITIVSILPGVTASFVALSILSRREPGRRALLAGGTLIGCGIAAMHYTGMAAMHTSLSLRYDLPTFALSLLLAVVLSTLALWVRFGLRQRLAPRPRLLISASVMACAIAGTHYTGMAAARFVGQIAPGKADGASDAFLALALSLITVAFTVFVASANGWLRYRELFLQLSQSESWMRALLTTTIDGVITVERNGTIREFNASAERIFGWSRQHIVGRNISLLVADPDAADHEALLNFLRTGQRGLLDRESETLGVRQNGSTVPLRRALGHAGELFVLFITDISERRAIEQALRDSEQQFRSLIGNIPGISFRCGTLGTQQLAFISDGVERVAGYPAADFLQGPARRTLNSLILEQDRARVDAVVARSVADEQPYLVEYRLRHADGGVRWLWEHAAIVAGEDGRARWIDGVILDISERRQMEEDLRQAKDTAEQAAAARASFVANMSHEIRTPMNSILGFTDVLLDGPLDAEQRRHLDTIRNAGRSLLRLLNEILDTAKLDKGAVELEAGDYSLLALLDELSSTFGGSARGKGLTVDMRYDPALPPYLYGDEMRMRQIITNLLDNAIKFTTTGGVALLAEARDASLHIVVQDSGIGIPADRLEAIFAPFTQADASMTRRYGGTGLGTTISRQLVDLMGGSIWAESAPGQGAAFHILLPLEAAREAPLAAGERSAFALPPLRVLAADDVPQNLELLSILLGKHGHSLRTAADGVAAVHLAAQEDFDLILMDVQMPRMDGLDATRAIRAAALSGGRARVPVVAMTASVLDAHRRASAEAGMDGFAAKPVDWIALSHEIARVLGLETVAPGLPRATAAAGQRVLNRKAGLLRWAGGADAYLRALQRFGADHASAGAELTALSGAGRHPEAQALAHRIRGVAANLGLEQLASTLARVEQLCAAHGADAAAMSEALSQLVAQLPAALLAIRGEAAPAAAPLPARPAASFDPAAVRTAAARLLKSLARGEFDDVALAALADGLGGQPGQAARNAAAQLGPLRLALDDFDFPLAQSALRAVLATLDAEPTR